MLWRTTLREAKAQQRRLSPWSVTPSSHTSTEKVKGRRRGTSTSITPSSGPFLVMALAAWWPLSSDSQAVRQRSKKSFVMQFSKDISSFITVGRIETR